VGRFRQAYTGIAGVFGGYGGQMLALLAITSTVSGMVKLVIPVVLPRIIADFEFGSSVAGFAFSAMTVSNAVALYVGGRSSDQLNRKTIIAVALAVFVLGLFLIMVSPGFALLLFGMVVVGTAYGLYFSTSFAQLADLFTDRRGLVFGVNNGAFTLGNALAPGLAVSVLTVGSWRATFVPMVVAFLLLFFAVHLLNIEDYVTGTVKFNVRTTVSRLAVSPGVRRSVLALGITAFVWQGFLNFLPTYLHLEWGYSEAVAGTVFGTMFLAGMAFQPAAGFLADRVGYARVAGLVVGLATTGLITIVFAFTGEYAIAGSFAAGIGISAFWPVMNTYLIGEFPDGTAAGDFGTTSAVSLGIGSLGPTFLGIVAERFTYALGFAGFAVCLGVVLALLVLLELS